MPTLSSNPRFRSLLSHLWLLTLDGSHLGPLQSLCEFPSRSLVPEKNINLLKCSVLGFGQTEEGPGPQKDSQPSKQEANLAAPVALGGTHGIRKAGGDGERKDMRHGRRDAKCLATDRRARDLGHDGIHQGAQATAIHKVKDDEHGRLGVDGGGVRARRQVEEAHEEHDEGRGATGGEVADAAAPCLQQRPGQEVADDAEGKQAQREIEGLAVAHAGQLEKVGRVRGRDVDAREELAAVADGRDHGAPQVAALEAVQIAGRDGVLLLPPDRLLHVRQGLLGVVGVPGAPERHRRLLVAALFDEEPGRLGRKERAGHKDEREGVLGQKGDLVGPLGREALGAAQDANREQGPDHLGQVVGGQPDAAQAHGQDLGNVGRAEGGKAAGDEAGQDGAGKDDAGGAAEHLDQERQARGGGAEQQRRARADAIGAPARPQRPEAEADDVGVRKGGGPGRGQHKGARPGGVFVPKVAAKLREADQVAQRRGIVADDEVGDDEPCGPEDGLSVLRKRLAHRQVVFSDSDGLKALHDLVLVVMIVVEVVGVGVDRGGRGQDIAGGLDVARDLAWRRSHASL